MQIFYFEMKITVQYIVLMILRFQNVVSWFKEQIPKQEEGGEDLAHDDRRSSYNEVTLGFSFCFIKRTEIFA